MPEVLRSRLLAALALAAGLVALSAARAPAAAAAVQVTGTFRYDDRSWEGHPDTKTGLRPIAHAEVEIWRFKPRFLGVWSWAKDARTTTDAAGRISVPMSYERSGIVYAVRILATNYAAVVWPNDAVHVDPFVQEPGQPDGAKIHRTARRDGEVLEFSYDFTDRWTPQHFNLAETVRRGHEFVAARRGDHDPLLRANVQPTSASPTGTYYDPVNDTLVIATEHVFYDMLVLHEYAHFVEETISALPWLPTFHDGCVAKDAFGNVVNSGEHAWMEGFADWFAQAVPDSDPAADLRGTAGTPQPWELENPWCPPGPNGVTPDEVEDFVSGSLWDLFDQAGDDHAAPENLDTLGRRDREVVQILDNELDTSPRNPTIWDFRNAWRARGLSAEALDQILVLNRIMSPAPPPPPPPAPTPTPTPTDPGDTPEPPEWDLCDRKPWLCEDPPA